MIKSQVPQVEVTSTTAGPSGWLASGIVKFSISGDQYAPAVLTFDFSNAPNQRAAIQQAAEQLLQAAQSQRLSDFELGAGD
jgi:hypothetical protein